MNHDAAAVDTRYFGTLAEGAKHHRDAAVAQEVRGGLVAAAGEVEVGDARLVEHAKGVHPLGRQVNAAFGRGGGDEEDQLRAEEFGSSGVMWSKNLDIAFLLCKD